MVIRCMEAMFELKQRRRTDVEVKVSLMIDGCLSLPTIEVQSVSL